MSEHQIREQDQKNEKQKCRGDDNLRDFCFAKLGAFIMLTKEKVEVTYMGEDEKSNMLQIACWSRKRKSVVILLGHFPVRGFRGTD